MQLYRRGDRGPAVAEIRTKLARLGLLRGGAAERPEQLESAEFDDDCDRAVRAFQQQRGLTVDGIVGPETYRVLEEARWSLGDRLLHYQVRHPYVGDDVAELQRRLFELGFDAGRVDGIFGHGTGEALREFQRNVGLAPDGTFGPSTIRAMAQLRRAVVGGAPDRLREHEALHRAGPTLAGKVVIVDPAYGGGEFGCTTDALRESEIAYDLAARIEGRLVAAGATAFLTRSREQNPSVTERSDFANSLGASLFLSLHCDSAPSPTANGVATYYFGSAGHTSAVGERLAELVQNEIVARTDLLSCRTHAKTWELLRRTRMPSVRIAVGFLTNPHDAARLADGGFRDTVAEAVLVAVQRLYLSAEEDPGTGEIRLPALQAVAPGA